ncbi:MAG: DUF6491 family protein [Hyphomonadaceae bacterium]
MFRTVLAAAAALSLGACATQSATETANTPRDCFHADNVSGYSYIDANHVAVTVGANRRYILSTAFNARDLDWTQAIAIRSTSNWICTGNGLGVQIIGGQPQRNYPINGIERAPDAEPAVEGS